MKENLDFLQKAKLTAIGANRSLFSYSNSINLPSISVYCRRLILFLGLTFYGLGLNFGQVSVTITSPNPAPADICAEAPFTITAATTPAGLPLIWRSKNGAVDNGLFSDSLGNTTNYTPNAVAVNRFDKIIVQVDEGYPLTWQNITNIDTTGGNFRCLVSGEGNSGARSVNVLGGNIDGWVETKVSNANVHATFGFSTTNPDNRSNTIDYGLVFSKVLGQVFVSESGVTPTHSTQTLSLNSTYRVERSGTTILYKKDRVVFHTTTISAAEAASALFVDASMLNLNDNLTNMDVSFGDNNYVFPTDTIDVQVLAANSIDIKVTSVTPNLDTIEICEGGTVSVDVASILGAPFGSWKTVGGTYNATTKVYTPTIPLTTLTRVDQVIGLTTASTNGLCPAASDTVFITIRQAPTLTPVTVTNICEGDSIRLISRPGGNADTVQWSSNAGIFTPLNGIEDTVYYKPDGSLTTATRVDKVFIETDSDFSVCPTTKDTVEITIVQKDTVHNTFENGAICEGDSIKMNAVLGKGATKIKWSQQLTNGVFINSDSTDAVYIPNAISTTDLTRSDTLYVTTVPTDGCIAFIDTVAVEVHKVAQLTLSADTTMCVTETALLRATNSRGSIDNIVRWDSIVNGVPIMMAAQSRDTLLIDYHTTLDITYPALSRKDTIIATTVITGTPPAATVSETCVAAQDTIIITLIDTANITIAAPVSPTSPHPRATCELDTINVKAQINTGATGVVWKLIPQHATRGVLVAIDSVETKYVPSLITSTTIANRKDTLMAISVGLTGCQPDTAYVEIQVDNSISFANVIDRAICDGNSSLVITSNTGITGVGAATPTWSSTTGTFSTNNVSATATATLASTAAYYHPSALVVNATTARQDKIFFTEATPTGTCPAFKDSLIVTINPIPVVTVSTTYGMDATNLDTIAVCEGDMVTNITSTLTRGASAATWTSQGTTGTFNPTNNRITAYTPNTGQTTDLRFDTLIVTTNTPVGCVADKDSLIIRVERAVDLSVANDTVTCESGMLKLSALASGVDDTIFWESLHAAGTFESGMIKDTTRLVSDSVTYNPSLIADINQQFRVDTIRYKTIDPPGVCTLKEDTILISVYNAPTVEVADPTKSKDTLRICEGIGLSLDGAYGGGATGATWSVLNSMGAFSNTTNDTLTTYTPIQGVAGTERIDTVVLTANVLTGTCSGTVTDTLIVVVEKGPVVDAAIDSIAFCEGSTMNVKGRFSSVATGFTWSTKTAGIGTFTILTDTTATYTPTGTLTGLARTDILYLTSNNGTANCLTAIDSMEVMVVTKPVLDLGADLSMCGNLTQELTPQSIGTSNQLNWTSNSGTFAANPSPTGLYQPTFPIPTKTRTDGIIVSSQDSFGLCPIIKDTMLVEVIELARVSIGATGAVCEDDTLALNPAFSGNVNDFTFAVSNNDGIVSVANNQLVYIPKENTTQTDRIDRVSINLGDVDGTGSCPLQLDVVEVTVINTPRATLVGDTTICEGDQVNLLVENFGLIDNFTSSLSNSLINYPSVPPTLVNGRIEDNITLTTRSVDGFCPTASQQITVTIIGPTTINAGDDVEICTGFDVPLNGGAGLGVNVATWSVLNSAGTFSDPNKLDAVYTPNSLVGTTAIRTDTLILTSSASLSCLSGTDTLFVMTKSNPSVVLGVDQSILAGQTVQLNATLNNKVSQGRWSSSNGTFLASTLDAATYVPNSLGSLATRIDTIIYEALSAEPTCSNVLDTMLVTVVAPDAPTPISRGTDVDFCSSLCLDTLAANLDRNTANILVLAENIDPLDTCAVRADYFLKFWYPELGTPEPTTILDFPDLPNSILFDCDTRGEQNVNVYVAKDATNIQLCPVMIDVDDSFLTCGERIVSGRITTFRGEPIEGFDVFVENVGEVGGVVPQPVKTDADGRYEFVLNVNRSYQITPRNNKDLALGVTAFDNVVISRHILGIEPFASPFQTIAADVNRSGTVTAYDIVLIRKVVLARDNEFMNNDSWRFVDADYMFTDIASAASAPFMESFLVTENMGNVLDMDFIAVKIGDANGNVDPDDIENGFVDIAGSRSGGQPITLQTKDLLVEKGAVYEIPFQLVDAENVASYQFTMDFAGLELLDIKSGVATAEHFGLKLTNRHLLTTCWSATTADLPTGDWFTLQFKASQDGRLSQLLQLNSTITPIEAYTTDFEEVGVALVFEQTKVNDLELYQNRPNPFKRNTMISFALPKASPAQITILDIQGRVVQTLEGNFAAGYNEVSIELNELTGGLFYYRLETAFGTKAQKMMLVE